MIGPAQFSPITESVMFILFESGWTKLFSIFFLGGTTGMDSRVFATLSKWVTQSWKLAQENVLFIITPTAKRYTKRGKFFPSMPQVIFCSHKKKKKKKTHRGWVVAVQKKKLSSEFLIFVLFCDKTDVQINLLAPAID